MGGFDNLLQDKRIEHSDAAIIAEFEKENGLQSSQLQTLRENPDPEKPEEVKEDKSFFERFQQKVGEEVGLKVQFGASMMDATQGLANSALDLVDWGNDFLRKHGVVQTDILQGDDRLDIVDKVFPEPENSTEKIVRAMGKHALLFTGAGVGKTAVQKFAAGTGIDAAFSFAAIDPDEKRLADLIQEYPDLRNPVSDYLASDESDSNLESRTKNALEAIAVDASVAGAFWRVLKGAKQLRKVNDMMKKGPQPDVPPPKIDPKAPPVKPEPKAPLFVDPSRKFVEIDPEQLTKARTAEELDKAANVSMNNISTEKDIRTVVKNTADVMKDEIDLVTRGKVKDQLTLELAEDLSMDPKVLINRGIGQAHNDREIAAMGMLLRSSAEDLTRLAKLAQGGDDASKAAFMESLNGYRAIHASFAGASAEAGRALRATQLAKKTVNSSEKVRLLNEQIKFAGGKQTTDEIIAMVNDGLDGVKNKAQFLSQIAQNSKSKMVKEAVMEVYINSILSSVKTPTVNIMSGMAAIGTNLFERGLGRGFTKMFGGKDIRNLKELSPEELLNAPGIVKGEFGAAMRGAGEAFSESGNAMGSKMLGMYEGAMDGIRLAGKELREKGLVSYANPRRAVNKVGKYARSLDQNSTGGDTVLEDFIEPAITSEKAAVLGVKKGTMVADGVDAIGAMIRTPGRILTSGDRFLKNVNYRMELRALAHRDAVSKGLSGEEMIRQINRTINNPPSNIKRKATGLARENTFTSDLDGAQKSMREFINTAGSGYGGAPLKLLMPFSRSSFNLINHQLDRLPGVNFLQKKWKADWNAGGASRAMAVAKMGTGTTLLGVGGLMAYNGIITGSGPANPNAKKLLKQSGWQKDSVKIGNQWVSFDRLDPIGNFIGLSADLIDIGGLLESEDSAQMAAYERVLGVSVMTFLERLSPEVLTNSMANLLEAVNDKDASFLAKNTVAGFLPFSGLQRDIRKIIDPTKRITEEELKDPNSPFGGLQAMINSLKNTIPGLSDDLLPQRNIWGEEIQYPTGLGPDIASPFLAGEPDDSPAMKEILRLGVTGPLMRPEPKPGESHLSVRMPSKVINKSIKGQPFSIKLNTKQYDKLVQLSAGKGLEGVAGVKLKDFLNREISAGYPTLGKLGKSDQARRTFIKSVISSYRRAAKAQFLRDDSDVNDRLRELVDQRKKTLSGEGSAEGQIERETEF